MTDTTTTQLSMDIKALIFRAGQQDQFGRTWPLAVFGRTRDGRSVTVQRNVRASVQDVASVLERAESWGMTHVTVGYDSCG